MEQFREHSKPVQALILFGIGFIIAFVLAVFVYGSFIVIDFFASIITDIGPTGSFAIHHGLIGLVMLALGIAGVAYNNGNRGYMIAWAVIGLVGLLLMVNDINDIGKWFLFVH